jgi:hypothetical protein
VGAGRNSVEHTDDVGYEASAVGIRSHAISASLGISHLTGATDAWKTAPA